MITTTKLIVIRHAESATNVDKNWFLENQDKVLGHTFNDRVPLTEQGIKDAVDLRGYIRSLLEFRYFNVWCSPYLRTVHTADLLLEGLRVGQRIEDFRLREVDIGQMYLNYDQIRDRVKQMDPESKFYYRVPGGESWADVAVRVKQFLLERKEEMFDADINVIVTHAWPCRLFRMFFDKLSIKQTMGLRKVDNLEIQTFEWEKDQQLSSPLLHQR